MPIPYPEPRITSTKNPRVRAAVDLRERRARDEAGLTIVDGARELARALAGGARVVEVFVDEDRLTGEGADAVDHARAAGASVVPVGGPVIDRLAYGDRSEGLVATVAIPELGLGGCACPPMRSWSCWKPWRSPATWARCSAAPTARVPTRSSPLIRAPTCSTPTRSAPRWGRSSPCRSRPAAAPRSGGTLQPRGSASTCGVDGAVPYTGVDLRGPVALVLGSEADGLTGAWTGEDVTAISLPMLGVADSLNVSIAAAVLLYEARRQRCTPARSSRRLRPVLRARALTADDVRHADVRLRDHRCRTGRRGRGVQSPLAGIGRHRRCRLVRRAARTSAASRPRRCSMPPTAMPRAPTIPGRARRSTATS